MTLSALGLTARVAPLLVAASIAATGCGSMDLQYEEPTQAPPPANAKPAAEPAAETTAEPEASAEAEPSDEVADAKRERLAEKLLAGSIGWNAQRKVFLIVSTYTEEGSGTGVIATVASEKDAYESQATLCEVGAGCESDSELLLSKASAWLKKEKLDKAIALEAVEFKPIAGFPTAHIGSLGGKLVFRKDHFDVVRGFKAQPLPKLEFAKEFTPTASQAAATPDGSLAVALFYMDPGANYAKGFNMHVDIKVFSVP